MRHHRILALSLCTLVAGCADVNANAPQADEVPTPLAAPSSVVEARRLIRALAGDPALSPRSVESILGQPAVKSEHPGTVSWTTTLPTGPFIEVELRFSDALPDLRLVNLRVRDGVAISDGDFQGDPITPDAQRSVEANIPPEGAVSYQVPSGPHQTTWFEFSARSNRLLAAGVHRNTD